MNKNGLKLVLGLCMASVSAFVSAMPITGVSVTTSFSSPGTASSIIENIANGIGLSSYTFGATHAIADPLNSWADLGTTIGSITFDLGGMFDLDGMAVWNFNANSTSGVRNLTIDSSLDGLSFLPIPGAPTFFQQGNWFATELAQLFSFTSTAQFIRFNVTASHGFVDGIGLSEVMFSGVRAAEAPVPATLALLGVGLAGLGWSRRKKV